jgi:hypothetical protein
VWRRRLADYLRLVFRIGSFTGRARRCSGLDVVRCDADSLHDEFGRRFQLLESAKQLHRTPFGTVQQFLYGYCRFE